MYSAATRERCFARLPLVLSSAASSIREGAFKLSVAELSLSASAGDDMRRRDSRRVMDSEIFNSRCRKAYCRMV